MGNFKDLQALSKGFKIVYVEDNNALRHDAVKLLKKVFDDVRSAEDGVEGLKIISKYRPEIVISDIKMPNMDGLTLGKKVKKIFPECKFIIMSAYDDKDKLMDAIEIGVFRFLKKPVSISALGDALHDAIVEIKNEQNNQLFYKNLQNIFQYQSSMVVMLVGKKPVIANQIFLDYFNVSTLEEYEKKYGDIGSLFLPHDGFLYNGDKDWYDSIASDEDKIFHVKMIDTDEKVHHFLLKSQSVPEQDEHRILSFDDVTELNLLKLFDEKETKSDKITQDSKALFKLLNVLERNSAKILLHNYYKGLSIINNGVIVDVKENTLVVKSNYLQQRAAKMEGKVIILNQALPHAVLCESIEQVNFENQTLELANLRFVNHSAAERSTVRIEPDGNMSVSLFLGENKFHGDIEIEDISIEAVNLKMYALPAGLNVGDKVTLDIVLEVNKKPIIINTDAVLYKKKELKKSFYAVFTYEGDFKKSDLIKYISKRQMEIIREFKRMKSG